MAFNNLVDQLLSKHPEDMDHLEMERKRLEKDGKFPQSDQVSENIKGRIVLSRDPQGFKAHIESWFARFGAKQPTQIEPRMQMPQSDAPEHIRQAELAASVNVRHRTDIEPQREWHATLDHNTSLLIIGNQKIKLEGMERKILSCLKTWGDPMTIEQIAAIVYNVNKPNRSQENVVRNTITTLRGKKLKPNELDWLFQSDARKGYALGNSQRKVSLEIIEQTSKPISFQQGSDKYDRTKQELIGAKEILIENVGYTTSGWPRQFWLTAEGQKFIADGRLDQAYKDMATKLASDWKKVSPFTKQETYALAEIIMKSAYAGQILTNAEVTKSCKEKADFYEITDASETNAEAARYLKVDIFYRAPVILAFIQSKLIGLSKNPIEARKKFGNPKNKKHYNILVDHILRKIELVDPKEREKYIRALTSVKGITRVGTWHDGVNVERDDWGTR